MRARPALTIARNDLWLFARDPTPVIILVVMPLVIIAFVKPAWALVLHGQGYPHATGAEQAVPGTAVMFGIFTIVPTGLSFFREYVWNTWDRLRAAPIRGSQLLVGKILPALLIVSAQQAIVFGVGGLALGLKVSGSVAGLIVVDACFALWVLMFGLFTIVLSRTYQQVAAVANLVAILLAALGGALTPLKTLPGWARSIAPISPTYWAMHGFNKVILEGRGFGAVLDSIGVLLAMALVFMALAAVRFRFDAQKEGTL